MVNQYERIIDHNTGKSDDSHNRHKTERFPMKSKRCNNTSDGSDIDLWTINDKKSGERWERMWVGFTFGVRF